MSTTPLGRPTQVVDRDTERDLTRAAKAVSKAREVADAAMIQMDEAVSRAYMNGTNVLRIAAILGVQRKTVYASLRRTGNVE